MNTVRDTGQSSMKLVDYSVSEITSRSEDQIIMNFEIIPGNRRSSELLYIIEQKMIYKKKSVYKNTIKYECRNKLCKARVNVMPDGKCVLAKKYIEHNHDNEEGAYKELKALNQIKRDCEDIGGALGGDRTAISSIRASFRKTCER